MAKCAASSWIVGCRSSSRSVCRMRQGQVEELARPVYKLDCSGVSIRSCQVIPRGMELFVPSLNGILETALYVDDLDRAARFYEDVLDLKTLTTDPRLRS